MSIDLNIETLISQINEGLTEKWEYGFGDKGWQNLQSDAMQDRVIWLNDAINGSQDVNLKNPSFHQNVNLEFFICRYSKLDLSATDRSPLILSCVEFSKRLQLALRESDFLLPAGVTSWRFFYLYNQFASCRDGLLINTTIKVRDQVDICY